MHGAVIFLGDPGLGGEVQLLKRKVRLAFEHGEQAPLDATPEVFLLAVDVWGVWERRQVQDAEVVKSCGELTADHRRAVVGHQRARQAHLLQRLAQAMDELLGTLVRVPLGVREEARAVVDEADQQGFDVGAAAGQHLA